MTPLGWFDLVRIWERALWLNVMLQPDDVVWYWTNPGDVGWLPVNCRCFGLSPER